MRRGPAPSARRVAAVLALGAALAATVGCGGDGSGDEAAQTDAPAAITSPSGAVCEGRAPSDAAAPRSYSAPPPQTIDPATAYTATLATSCGEIVVALDPGGAPVAVNNFVFLAREGFYDGLTFHRVVAGFVIQGGDPEGTGSGGPGYTFEDELPADGYPAGSVAMANAGPDTNGSQFFIVTGDASFLENDYTRFGTVTQGLDVARAIESFADPADPEAGTPTEPVYIDTVAISEG